MRPRQREGSPWTGLGAVFLKELADHLGSARMRVLEWLVLLTGVAAVYTAIQDFRSIGGQDPFLFLRLFTYAKEPLPAFVSLLGFLVPIIAIGLGFDSVNSEFGRRTLSRVLAQPIYRDALLLGKFLAGVGTLGISLLALWLLVIGLGLLLLGVPPSTEEVVRALVFLIIALAYGAVWLAVAILFSTVFRSAATAALASLGIWLLFSVLWPILVPFLVRTIAPSEIEMLFGIPSMQQIQLQASLSRLAPNTLFGEAVLAILRPTTRTLGFVFPGQLQGAVAGTPLPVDQSILLVWPQITGLVAGAILLFATSYIVFQRQEVRA